MTDEQGGNQEPVGMPADWLESLSKLRNLPAVSLPSQETIARLLAGRRKTDDLIARIGSSTIQDFNLNFDGLNSRMLRLLRTAGAPALTSARDYQRPESESAYSSFMDAPGKYFARRERTIASVADLHLCIEDLVRSNPGLTLVWRGAQNADWGVHSSLFRRLKKLNGVIEPGQRGHKEEQQFPDEDQMVAAEIEILRTAREVWRLDGLSALETFARIQHVGGPTRLLDVSKNPYIAAWFAVEAALDPLDEAADARLLAFSIAPAGADADRKAESIVSLDDDWGAYAPLWHAALDSRERQAIEWGTGARRRLWVPPAYDARIAAQNAGFILDGVPIASGKTASFFTHLNGDGTSTRFNRNDKLAAGSIYMKIYDPRRPAPKAEHNLAPTFAFRIAQSAKDPIRTFLHRTLGYSRSSIYPDVHALARELAEMPLPGLEPAVSS